MARQLNGFIEGTIDGITFYRMLGQYYARSKSSLTGKRFWTDSKFEGSRNSSRRFAEGNRIASAVYRLVPENERSNELYQGLKKEGIALLKAGRSAAETRNILEQQVCTSHTATAVQVQRGRNRQGKIIYARLRLSSPVACLGCRTEQKKRPGKSRLFVLMARAQRCAGLSGDTVKHRLPHPCRDLR